MWGGTVNNYHLKELRKKRGYTQQQVADELGVTKATISKYENGLRDINRTNIEKLSKLFKVDPIYILTGKSDTDWENIFEEDRQESEKQDREYWKTILFTGAISQVAPLLDQLNDEGQQKAIERVQELTEIPRYQKDKNA